MFDLLQWLAPVAGFSEDQTWLLEFLALRSDESLLAAVSVYLESARKEDDLAEFQASSLVCV